MKVSPSILAADLTDMKRILHEMDPKTVDLIHIDVMDGHFVPQLSFGEAYTKSVAAHTEIPLDVHLMVSRPELEVPKYFELKPYSITFHIEATHFPVRLSQMIRGEGIRTGVALNPGTPVETIWPILDHVDLILLMSVEPGFYGQKYIDSVTEKIKAVKERTLGHDIEIQVDGGVGTGNIKMLADAGVGIVVAGSACFKSGNVNDNVSDIKKGAFV